LVCDGIQFLAMNSRLLSADALVYCDPPYLHSTRVCTRHYRHEMTDAQHEEFLRVVKGLGCRVMVSGYSSPLYARMLKGWNATSFQAGTRGKPAAEWVWFNFDRPAELHDYRFLGDSKRERERIRRKQRRWVHRLAVMPLLERQALLSAIAETAGNGGAAGTSAEVAVFGGSAPGVRAAKK
jgi:DNA adenine methylase